VRAAMATFLLKEMQGRSLSSGRPEKAATLSNA
jgi:hypothetical protein